MTKAQTAQWKNEQRELLRAAFGPAFVKYSEMVHKVNEPDDYRKYLEFIARQVGLEEPTLKTSPHDGLTTVQINIGQFHQAARPVGGAPFAVADGFGAAKPINAPPFERAPAVDVVDAEPVLMLDTPQGDWMQHAQVISGDVLDAVPARPAADPNDFESLLDALVP